MELTLDFFASLTTLVILEAVLGIDNTRMIAITASGLPAELRKKARLIGMVLAFVMRVILILGVQWLVHLEDALFTLWGMGFSGSDLILIGGGAFLVWKATTEINH